MIAYLHELKLWPMMAAATFAVFAMMCLGAMMDPTENNKVRMEACVWFFGFAGLSFICMFIMLHQFQ